MRTKVVFGWYPSVKPSLTGVSTGCAFNHDPQKLSAAHQADK